MASSWWARTAAPRPTPVLHTDGGGPGRAGTASRDLTFDILPIDVHDWCEPATPLKARFSAGGERHSLILAIPTWSWQLPRCACAVFATDVRCRWPEVDVENRPVMETSPRNPPPNQVVVCSRCPNCPSGPPRRPGIAVQDANGNHWHRSSAGEYFYSDVAADCTETVYLGDPAGGDSGV